MSNAPLTEEQKSMLNEFADDFSFYATKCLKIQTMDAKLIFFKFNVCQRVLMAIYDHIEQCNRLKRVIILKARREGVSTFTTGRNYWKTSTNHNRYAVTVTHEPDATSFLFKMVKRYHAHTPEEFKPEKRYSNQKLLEFNTDDDNGLDSAFRVGTAGKEDFGSGQLIHYLHLSEIAKWPTHTQTELITSLFQCVPDKMDTEIVLESTAKGIGGEFYERYWNARYQYEVFLKDDNTVSFKCTINEKADRENEFSAVFLPWFVFEDYLREPAEDFFKTEAENVMAKRYNLSDKRLAWRRWAIENRCGGVEEVFQQEYPSNPKEAFLVSGTPIFNNNQCQELKEGCPLPIIRYNCQTISGEWMAHEHGALRVWEEPKVGRAYVIGADVAEGLAHGDFSSADVLDHRTGKMVAQWHGKIDPDEYGRVLGYLGKRYNYAWLGVERNNHGLTTLTILQQDKYKRLYVERIEEPPAKPRKRYGWLTTRATKPLVIDWLIEEMREESHGIVCAETFDEMMSFKKQDNGDMEADAGMFDDRVMSRAIAGAVRRKSPLPSQRMLEGKSNNRPRERGRIGRNRKPPKGSWT